MKVQMFSYYFSSASHCQRSFQGSLIGQDQQAADRHPAGAGEAPWCLRAHHRQGHEGDGQVHPGAAAGQGKE